MLVGENQAKHWMKLARREQPEGDLGKQTPNFWQDVRIVAGSHRAMAVFFPKPSD